MGTAHGHGEAAVVGGHAVGVESLLRVTTRIRPLRDLLSLV